MNEIIVIFSFTNLWTFNSVKIKNFISNLSINNLNFNKINFFVISLIFISSFVILSSTNILLHLFGLTLTNVYYLFLINIVLLRFYLKNIKIFLKNIINEICSYKEIFFKKIDFTNPIFAFLIFIILFQAVCLFLRFLLPVSHGDQLNQYFWDSLQISRLKTLSLNEYYEIGGRFRSDSMASFFDALILQLTDSWILVRSFRLISLLLVILSSVEIFYNLGNFNIKKGLILICIIITLPDVWDVALSGKHDGYVLLFEMIGIYSIILSTLISQKNLKFIFCFISILIGVASTSMRLSSANFLIISIILFIYYFFRFPMLLKKENLELIFSFKNLKKIVFVIVTLIPTLFIFLLNYKFFSNPFYKVSPPEILSNIFPNAQYTFNYSILKDE